MKLCVIGLGQMGSTLVRGIVENKVFRQKDITGCDINISEIDLEGVNIKTVSDNRLGVKDADIVLLAVKPQVMDSVMEEISDLLDDKLVISIAAGITLFQISKKTPDTTRPVRVMPNTPALINEGISAISYHEDVNDDDKKIVRDIFNGVGDTIEIKEELMDVITGLSGSGPAYIYLMIEALADGAVLKGLPRQKAYQLAARTMIGAAKMVIETGKHPGELKDMVTSPAGTTIAGIEELEKGGLRGILIETVKKATERSQEL